MSQCVVQGHLGRTNISLCKGFMLHFTAQDYVCRHKMHHLHKTHLIKHSHWVTLVFRNTSPAMKLRKRIWDDTITILLLSFLIIECTLQQCSSQNGLQQQHAVVLFRKYTLWHTAWGITDSCYRRSWKVTHHSQTQWHLVLQGTFHCIHAMKLFTSRLIIPPWNAAAHATIQITTLITNIQFSVINF